MTLYEYSCGTPAVLYADGIEVARFKLGYGNSAVKLTQQGCAVLATYLRCMLITAYSGTFTEAWEAARQWGAGLTTFTERPEPTPEQVAAAKAYFAAKKPTQQERLTYLVHADCVRLTQPYAALAPHPDFAPALEHFAPALASVLSAGLSGEVQP